MVPTGNALFFDMLWDATDINKEMHGSCLNKFQEKSHFANTIAKHLVFHLLIHFY